MLAAARAGTRPNGTNNARAHSGFGAQRRDDMTMGLVSGNSGDESGHALGAGAPLSSFALLSASPIDWQATHDVLFCPRADEAYFVLDAQICAVQILSSEIESARDKAFVERCVAHLDGVRDALYELHFGVFEGKTRRSDCPRFPLGAYLVAGHLWCRVMLEGLRRYALQPRASTVAALADHSSGYVRNHVEPLFRELVVRHEADSALRPILPRAERVFVEIVRLSWTPEG
jgi:hypothetical protein